MIYKNSKHRKHFDETGRLLCAKCKASKLISEFMKDPSGRFGYCYTCKACRKVFFKTYNASDHRINLGRKYYYADPKKAYESRVKWAYKNKTKTVAMATVHRAIKRGFLTKQPCCICGALRSAAHHSDYNKPLEVMWLCHSHHRAWHRVFLAEEYHA